MLWMGPPTAVPQPVGPGRWHDRARDGEGSLAPAALAYYPLWRASADGRALPTRRGSAGQLEVQLPPGRTVVDLTYHRRERLEWTGLALSALGPSLWLGVGWNGLCDTIAAPRRRSMHARRYRLSAADCRVGALLVLLAGAATDSRWR